MDDVFRLLHHLIFGNPKGGTGNGDSEIVDLNAVELAYTHLDRVDHIPQRDLSTGHLLDRFILQFSKTGVGFREEIPGTCCRIQKHKRSKLILKGFQFSLPRPPHINLFYFFQFCLQIVQEERINYLVDVLQ